MISAVTTVDALIMTIMGGMGTLIGPVIGAGISQVIQQFFYTWFGARWPLVFGLIFILIVMFFPYGIVGTWQLKKANRKAGWLRFKRLFLKDQKQEEIAEIEEE
jgi:ABC-type branched-subunit amino acid transport system permease subunit